MPANLVARASIVIDAPIQKVWTALLDPEAIREYMFGTRATSDWREGSPISWKGEWKGKAYEDKGVVLRAAPPRTLKYTHFSPLAGLPDKPENYHTVEIELSSEGATTTRVALNQDNNATEESRRHSEENWKSMLDGLKKYVEGRPGVG
jgi:uncharacterized protein YndB with AHSA1/START domain